VPPISAYVIGKWNIKRQLVDKVLLYKLHN
jgi:hypothetical protein